MALPWLWAVTILPWPPKLSRSFGRVSDLPTSSTATFSHKLAIPLPGSWTCPLEPFWEEVTPAPYWMQLLCGIFSAHISIATESRSNIKHGHLYALAISATNYNSGKSYLFIQGTKGHPMWNRSRRVTLATKITVDHICASAAIPLVFQPVRLKTARGTAFFGDGCLRLQQPLSPIIRLGAKRIFAIGVRGRNLEHQEEAADERDPSLAQVMGVLFNVMFLDHLATDIEHLERLNELLRSGQINQLGHRRM